MTTEFYIFVGIFQELDDHGFHIKFIKDFIILDLKDDTIVKYVMKFKFVVKFGVNGRTKGDIEALADARRALKNRSQI